MVARLRAVGATDVELCITAQEDTVFRLPEFPSDASAAVADDSDAT